MRQDEPDIIVHILAGKTELFAYFLDTYAPQVFNLIARMVGNEKDAEELTQDTFMKAFQRLSSFHSESTFSTWVYRIAYNTALSALRKEKNECLAITDKQWECISDQEADSALNDESEERIAALQKAVDRLSPEEKAIITWFYEEGKSIAEIAQITKQTESNIKVRLHRIRKKLYILITAEEG